MQFMRITASLLLLAAPEIVCAEELNQANTAWILTSTALVLFMTLPGLSLFYAGLVRSKNALSVLMQCFAITCIVSILWLAGVYSFIFADCRFLVMTEDFLWRASINSIGTETFSGHSH